LHTNDSGIDVLAMKRDQSVNESPDLIGDVHWDLSDLIDDPGELSELMQRAEREADQFYERYHGRLETLEAAELQEALEEFESILERIGRAYSFAYLRWTTNTEDAGRGARLQQIRERHTQIKQQLVFVKTEWAAFPEERAEQLMEEAVLAPYEHFLEVEYLKREHVLSEPEEKIFSEKQLTGRSAWNRFFDETFGAARFSFRAEELTQQEILSKLYTTDRSVRRDAAMAFTEELRELRRTTTFVFNTILADKAADDRLRGYPTWIASRNEANEISDEMVDALVEAVTGRYDIVARFYKLKTELLGIDQMFDYDRYAPVGSVDRQYGWDSARETVLNAYYGFSDTFGSVAQKFFDEQWIDATVTAGKRGGAFSASTVPSVHPYVLMNFTGQPRDVQTLAHELGHGIHQFLARSQGVLQADTPLTTAETASVFGEMLVFRRMLEKEDDPQIRLAMLVQKIDDTIATVFRQVAMNRFEHRIHTARRSDGELTTEQYNELWLETQAAMFRGSVTLGEHYRYWWSYIPHFIHTPGYVYAYAFGELLVLALYTRYQEEAEAFAVRYEEMLRAGGSEWPDELVGRLGVDLTDPMFWTHGLTAVEELVDEVERIADTQDAET
jgi:oligoendopeptidase F